MRQRKTGLYSAHLRFGQQQKIILRTSSRHLQSTFRSSKQLIGPGPRAGRNIYHLSPRFEIRPVRNPTIANLAVAAIPFSDSARNFILVGPRPTTSIAIEACFRRGGLPRSNARACTHRLDLGTSATAMISKTPHDHGPDPRGLGRGNRCARIVRCCLSVREDNLLLWFAARSRRGRGSHVALQFY